jgi:hypothetical protein
MDCRLGAVFHAYEIRATLIQKLFPHQPIGSSPLSSSGRVETFPKKMAM